MKANVQHSSRTPEHGTPVEFVELARETLGGIDLDPASSHYWNYHLVKATTFYDRRANGLVQTWAGRVFLNPPGEKDDSGKGLVRQFWDKLIADWKSGRVHSAVWIGFTLEQLTSLQSSPMHPLQLMTCVPPARIAFMSRLKHCSCGWSGKLSELVDDDGARKRTRDQECTLCPKCRNEASDSIRPPVKGESPTHGNYITLLHHLGNAKIGREQSQRFCDLATSVSLGCAIVRPL